MQPRCDLHVLYHQDNFQSQIAIGTAARQLSPKKSALLALIPFLVLCVLLYLVGRDLLLFARSKRARAR